MPRLAIDREFLQGYTKLDKPVQTLVNEVFAKFDMEGGDDAPYPGDAAVRTASEECIGTLFEDYVGLDYQSSRFDVFPITPTQDTWESDLNDREIICTANTVDGTPITGSIQGTAE